MENKKKRIKLGDVYVIPLPNGKYAFGRVMRDAGFAIYKHIGNSIEDIPKNEEYQFVVGVYKDVLQCGIWKVVDNRPFNNEEQSWPPKTYIIDKINGSYSIYHKGEISSSTQEECEGLEKAAIWDAHHIIDRIMGKDKWNLT